MMHAFTIIFGFSFALLHALAEALSLYWHYEWLDMPMHVLGGIVLVCMWSSLSRIFPRLRQVTSRMLIFGAVCALVSWEVFGIYRFQGIKPSFWFDTVTDIACGATGLILGVLLVRVLSKIELLTKHD